MIGPLVVRAILSAVAVLIALVGVAVMARAGYLGLAEVLHPAWAAAVTAVGLLVLAGLLCLPALLASRRRRPPPAAGPPEDAVSAAFVAGDQVMGAVRRHPAAAGIGAFAAGVVIGYCPRLRRAILELLSRTGGP